MSPIATSATAIALRDVGGASAEAAPLAEEEVRQVEAEQIYRLRLQGAITAGTSQRVRRRFQEHAEHEAGLLVDLQGVTALDATGVAALLGAQRAVRRHEHGVLVLRPNRIVSEALKHSGTITAFQV